jgi:hypothetical protein
MTSRLARLSLLLLAVHAGAALAQYKCTASNGAVTFQDTPCLGARSEEKLTVVPNGHPPPASGVAASPLTARTAASAVAGKPETSVDKRMLANYERQHQRDALEQALKSAQDDRDRRAAQRLDAIAAARRQFGDDPSNAQLLRDALASIDSRYKAFGEIDESRVASAQAALDKLEATPAP